MKKTLVWVGVLVAVVGAAVWKWWPRHAETPALAPVPSAVVEKPVPSSFRQVLEAYEGIRASLAKDEFPKTGALDEALAQAMTESPDTLALKEAQKASQSLTAAKDVEAARLVFGDLSRAMVGLVQADRRLQEGLFLFTCPMAEGFAEWFQKSPRLENPYMGTRMIQCGNAVAWAEPVASLTVSHEGHGHKGSDTAYFTCPMHPSIRKPTMGQCPICGMDLTPVTFDEIESGVVRVDDSQRKNMGLETAAAKKGPMRRVLRAAGRVTFDETQLREVNVRQGGFVTKLFVAATGEPVRKGQTLFTLYSPELLAAQQEYVLALQSQRNARQTSAPDRADALVMAARARLRLWDVADETLETLARTGKPLEAIPFASSVTGYVVEKDIVEGAAVMPGQRLFRLASLDKVWVEANVYEADLPLVRVGQKAKVSVPNQPGRVFEATVTHIHPSLEVNSRSTEVRLELSNKDKMLKPDMYADVLMEMELGERLQIPSSAVLYAGPRWLVFVDLGDGRFKPQEVQLGLRLEDFSEVVSGVKEGERVVTSGNFLIAAESRLKSASKFWENSPNDSK